MPFIVKVVSDKSVGYLKYDWVSNSWLFDLETAQVYQDSNKDVLDHEVEKAYNSNYNVSFDRQNSKVEKVEV
jgi:hypothetical protein